MAASMIEKYIVDCFRCCGYQSGVSSLPKFSQLCMHDFERNINDRNLKQLLIDYPRQCPGCELKQFHNNLYSASKRIEDYILEC